MTNSTKILIGTAIAGAIGYVSYLHFRICKLSSMLDVAVDKLSEDMDISISDDLLEQATQRAINREVKYISNRIGDEAYSEIKYQVKNSVNDISDDIKKSVAAEIANQVKRVNTSDMEREVIRQAKTAVAEKFDSKLNGLLEEFNDNLNNIQKIYSSIAKSMSKD